MNLYNFMKKIIQFELNEVPMRVIKDFCLHNPYSSFAKIYNNSKKIETFANDQGHLSPWVTWPTIHRGINNEKHTIGFFGQNLEEIDNEFPPLWNILRASNIDVGMFGSLHSYPLPKELNNFKFYVPDTFANGPECFPKNISYFQDFNLKMVDVSNRNVQSKLPIKEALKFSMNFYKLGISNKTIFDITSQIFKEKAIKERVVRRRSLQAQISFDIFYKNLLTFKPTYSTFFTNHVASAQHRYWLAKYPNDYKNILYDDSWIEKYNHEIDYAMQTADKFLKKIISFINNNNDYQLLLLSSMGQEATDNTNPVRSQLYIDDFDRFMSFLNFQSNDYSKKRSMLPQINFTLNKNIDELCAKLNKFRINGELIQYDINENFCSISVGHENLKINEIHISYDNEVINHEFVGFKNILVQDEANTTAYHMPMGILFSYPNYNNEEPISQISTTEIAPSILNNFNVQRLDYMSKPIKFY